MFRTFRRMVARRIARKIDRGIVHSNVYECRVAAIGLFGDSERTNVQSSQRVNQLQVRVNRAISTPRTHATITKEGSTLIVKAARQ